MKINADYSNHKSAYPTFGNFKTDAAEKTLRQVLSFKELEEFKALTNEANKFNLVDVIFFGEGKKLSANVADRLCSEDSKVTHHSQRFFESPMHFIKRMMNKMADRTPAVEELAKKRDFKF